MNIMTDFEHLKTMSTDQVLTRRQSLLANIDPKDFKDAPDEVLVELVAIARVLKTRGAPPRVTSGSKKAIPTLDAL